MCAVPMSCCHRVFRTSIILLAVNSSSVPMAMAGLPKSQTTTSAFDFRAVVNITTIPDDQNPLQIRGGTGTVIGSFLNPRTGMGTLCILTADHNISKNGEQTGGLADGILVTSRNFDGGQGTPITKAVRAGGVTKLGIFRQGISANAANKWDLAVLGVPWGVVDPGTQDGTEFMLLSNAKRQVDIFDNDKLHFTGAGYGQSGELDKLGNPVNVGYLHDDNRASDSDLKKRFWNNTVTAIRDAGGSKGYVHPEMRWILDNVDPVLKSGEGSGLPGDSGAPLFFQDPGVLDVYGSEGILARSESIRGVLDSTDLRRVSNEKYLVAFGDFGYGVRITSGIKDWITTSCNAVPEPGSLILMLAAGTLLASVRRRACRGASVR